MGPVRVDVTQIHETTQSRVVMITTKRSQIRPKIT